LNSALPNELRRNRTTKAAPMGQLNHLADRSVDLEAILPWRRT
jgi:hypothetical protein